MKNTLLLYDERELAHQIFLNGFTNREFNFEEAFLLCKYFRYVLGYKDARIKTKLIEFSKSNDLLFNEILERKIINRIVKQSSKKFWKTGNVNITKNELDRIREIRNFKVQKIALAILFISKRETNNGWFREHNRPDIKKVLSRNVIGWDIDDVIAIMYEKGMSEPSGENNSWDDDGSTKIKFIDKDGYPVISVDTEKKARNLGELYKAYCGGELGYCRTCHNEFIKNSTRQAYCENCKREREKERKRNWWNNVH